MIRRGLGTTRIGTVSIQAEAEQVRRFFFRLLWRDAVAGANGAFSGDSMSRYGSRRGVL